MRWLAAALFALSAVLHPWSAWAQDGRLLVFAAASLRDALEAVTERYTAEENVPVAVSYASSSTLARQIAHRAPADLYLSANQQWMDYLEERGAIVRESRVDLLGNALVLIAPRNSPVTAELDTGTDIATLLADSYLAMGDPAHVPAGIYGEAALRSLGAWETVRQRVARADNVRAALALVARGEAPLGIVYRSDARAEEDVRVVNTFPQTAHPPIIYPAAVTAASDRTSAARSLLDFLRSPRATETFEEFGFDVLQ